MCICMVHHVYKRLLAELCTVSNKLSNKKPPPKNSIDWAGFIANNHDPILAMWIALIQSGIKNKTK